VTILAPTAPAVLVRPLGATGALVRWRGRLRGADVGFVHAGLVLAVAAVLRFLPAGQRAAAVLAASTNLDNLAVHPFRVLLLSAFVVPTGTGLLVLLPLVPVLAAAQRRFGRRATVGAFALGHVGATLVVAGFLLTGVRVGWVDPSVASAVDVGVSYGLACVAGLLVASGPSRWRRPGLAVVAGGLLVALVVDPDFTAVGHLVALALGAGLGSVVTRTAQGTAPSRRWETTRPARGGTREAPSTCRGRSRRPGRDAARGEFRRDVRAGAGVLRRSRGADPEHHPAGVRGAPLPGAHADAVRNPRARRTRR
jgi:hypothetical protein